jgi:hypothetical protein
MKTLSQLADELHVTHKPTTRCGVTMSSRLLAFGFAGVGALLSTAVAAAHGDCDTKTVKLPPQKVILETSSPTFGHKDRGYYRSGVVPLGTLYMPLQLPLAGYGYGVTAPPPSTSGPDETINKALEAENYKMRAMSARAAFEAEVKHKQDLLKRLSTATSGTGTGTADVSALDDTIKKINDRLDAMNDRMAAVEKLLIVHDNYIQEQLKKTPAPAPAPEMIAPPKK